MSRVGKLPVAIPEGVQVDLREKEIVVKGKLGELAVKYTDDVKVSVEENKVWVKPVNDSQTANALWGTVRSNISNLMVGVQDGYNIRLVVFGVGYNCTTDGKLLTLKLGYSHEIKYAIPTDIEIKCEKPTLLVVSGASKQKVGQVAGEIMKLRKVEPYKGKGIYIEGSYVRRKEGKKK